MRSRQSHSIASFLLLHFGIDYSSSVYIPLLTVCTIWQTPLFRIQKSILVPAESEPKASIMKIIAQIGVSNIPIQEIFNNVFPAITIPRFNEKDNQYIPANTKNIQIAEVVQYIKNIS